MPPTSGLRMNDEETVDDVRTRTKEARAQARFAAELATLEADYGRWFVVGQSANSTMWKTKAMRRTASDAHIIVVSVKSEVDDEEMRFATNTHQVGKRISECGRTEDVRTAICAGLREQMASKTSIDYEYPSEYFDEKKRHQARCSEREMGERAEGQS